MIGTATGVFSIGHIFSSNQYHSFPEKKINYPGRGLIRCHVIPELPPARLPVDN